MSRPVTPRETSAMASPVTRSGSPPSPLPADGGRLARHGLGSLALLVQVVVVAYLLREFWWPLLSFL